MGESDFRITIITNISIKILTAGEKLNNAKITARAENDTKLLVTVCEFLPLKIFGYLEHKHKTVDVSKLR